MSTKKNYEAAIKKLEEAQALLELIGKEDQKDFDADRIAGEVDDLLNNEDSGLKLIASWKG